MIERFTPARWDEYPNFAQTEFNCRATGRNQMKHEFMQVLQRIRTAYGQPLRVTSGYRDPAHPVEARKGHSNGEHTKGTCCDVACTDGRARHELIKLAMQHGVHRIGIAKSFIHLGIGGYGLPPNVIWEYQ